MHSINIVSDVACPWCIVGYLSLKAALDELDVNDSVKITWHPFELEPDMPAEGQDRSERLMKKYGMNNEQLKANQQHLIDCGLEVGYEFNFQKDARSYNTFDAHRLIHWAKQHNLQTELKLAVFDLYFKHASNPSDHQALLQCAEAVGLPTDKAAEVLASDDFTHEVRTEQTQSQQQGISSVPTFIFNKKYLVSGAQTKDKFINVLNALDKETKETA